MDEQQLLLILQALSDLQTSIDALGLDVQDLKESITGEGLAIPAWVGSGAKSRVWENVSAALELEGLEDARQPYPPAREGRPRRGRWHRGHSRLRGGDPHLVRNPLPNRGRGVMEKRMLIHCTNCGHSLAPEYKFCGYCGAPARETATEETASLVEEPSAKGSSEARVHQDRAPRGPLAVTWFLTAVLFIQTVMQGMNHAPPDKSVPFQIGFSSVPAFFFVIAIWVLVLFLGGGYYLFARNKGVTFLQAIFNWPMVGLLAVLTVVNFL